MTVFVLLLALVLGLIPSTLYSMQGVTRFYLQDATGNPGLLTPFLSEILNHPHVAILCIARHCEVAAVRRRYTPGVNASFLLP
jgi:hypothetical protein